jgi:hypothetical protein
MMPRNRSDGTLLALACNTMSYLLLVKSLFSYCLSDGTLHFGYATLRNKSPCVFYGISGMVIWIIVVCAENAM